jgi:hypothetical protein
MILHRNSPGELDYSDEGCKSAQTGSLKLV